MCREQKIPDEIFMPNLKKIINSTALFTSLLTFSRRETFKNRGKITVEVIGHNSWYSKSSQTEALPVPDCGLLQAGWYQHLCWMVHYCRWKNKYMLALSGEENSPSPNDPPHFPLLNIIKAI